VTGVATVTPPVFTTVNALSEPAGMTIEPAVDATALFELESTTVAPPAGAAFVSEAVRIAVLPPMTDGDETDSVEIEGEAVEDVHASAVPAPPNSNAPMSIAPIALRTSPQPGCTYS
jgi:hypothetical protein